MKPWLDGLPLEAQKMFEGHVASLLSLGTEEKQLRWFTPGTLVGSVFYTVIFSGMNGDGTLVVTGDLRNAVYQIFGVHQGERAALTVLEVFRDASVGYWSEKCVASETGMGYRYWDGKALQIELHNELAVHRLDNPDQYDSEGEHVDPAVAELIEDIGRDVGQWESYEAAGDWLRHAPGAVLLLDGDDSGESARGGYVVHHQLALHRWGLRAALAYLEGIHAE